MKVCIVNTITNVVENVGVFGENLLGNLYQPPVPPEGYLWIFDENAGKDWIYESGHLVAPSSPPPINLVDKHDGYDELKAALITKGVLTQQEISDQIPALPHNTNGNAIETTA